MFGAFDVITSYLSGIYNAITMPFIWMGYIIKSLFNVIYLPSILQAYVPSVLVPAIFVVVSVGIIRTVLSLLPF